MASLIHGFEYDIFISYRHNDNRSGWVSDFVEFLKAELAATIKEPLSIYFDKNAEDGLLETHVVNKSLEGKLRCLIFIPIISQTYCDEKSFAWSQEFCAFNRLATTDVLGRDIKLSNGNVGSRILPVRIHDLDVDDQSAIEKETGNVLRAIEFIYKEPGVNRPLNPGDNRHDNKNNTDYRNQVNKVANAIKEITSAIRSPGRSQTAQQQTLPVSSGQHRLKPIMLVALLIVVLIAGYFVFAENNPAPIMEQDKSVAVLAFADMSPAKDQEWFSDGLSEEILNSLANLHELKVTARTSSFYYKGKDVPLHEIAAALGVAHIVEGSVRRNGQQLRITAQLIRAKDGFHIWSDTYDRTADDVFRVQTEIAENIARILLNELSPETQAKLVSLKSHNVEAYESYLKGYRAHFQKYALTMRNEDLREAEMYFLKSLSLDPGYAEAYGALADLYDTRSLIPEDRSRYWQKRDSLIRIGLRLNPNSAQTNCVNGWSFLKRPVANLDSSYFYFKKAYDIYPNTDFVIAGIAGFYGSIGLTNLELEYYRRALEIDPLHVSFLTQLALSNMNLGFYEESKRQFLKVTDLDSSNAFARHFLGEMAATLGDRNELTEQINAIKAMKAPRHLEETKTLRAMASAIEGDRTDAMNFKRKSIRVLSVLKMKDKLLSQLDSISNLPFSRFNAEGLKHDPQFDFLRDDPRFDPIIKRFQNNNERMMAAYPPPD